MVIGLVGGGTGGHFYPLIAVAEEYASQAKPPKLLYFGPNPYDKDLLEQHKIHFVRCPAGKLRRYFSPKNFLDALTTLYGIVIAIGKLYYHYPDVIFSKGGYTAIPILCAAWFLRIPVVIHESDSTPGRANRFASSFARYIAVSYPSTADQFPSEKTALTGIPIRRSVLTPHPSAFAELSIPDDSTPLLYITGGSLGSERINNAILQLLPELLPYVRIFHQTGDAHEHTIKHSVHELLVHQPELLERYYVAGSVPGPTVASLLDAADLIITRAGSTTLHEIALHQKPSIVIPIPEEVSHDQRTNAFAYARRGAAVVIEEHNLTNTLLKTEIFSILQDADRYQRMKQGTQEFAKPNAAHTIAQILLEIGYEHGS